MPTPLRRRSDGPIAVISEEGYHAERREAIRRSGLVELLSGLRNDLMAMRDRGEFEKSSEAAREAIDLRIAELDRALEDVRTKP